MLFTYRCENGHVVERDFPVGEAAQHIGPCSGDTRDERVDRMRPKQAAPCGSLLIRYFGPETLPQIAAVDPFRAYHLSPRKEDAQVRQQRYVDAPTDRADARAQEKARGIAFVGDDTSGMSAGARRGIEKHQARVRSGEVKV